MTFLLHSPNSAPYEAPKAYSATPEDAPIDTPDAIGMAETYEDAVKLYKKAARKSLVGRAGLRLTGGRRAFINTMDGTTALGFLDQISNRFNDSMSESQKEEMAALMERQLARIERHPEDTSIVTLARVADAVDFLPDEQKDVAVGTFEYALETGEIDVPAVKKAAHIALEAYAEDPSTPLKDVFNDTAAQLGEESINQAIEEKGEDAWIEDVMSRTSNPDLIKLWMKQKKAQRLNQPSSEEYDLPTGAMSIDSPATGKFDPFADDEDE